MTSAYEHVASTMPSSYETGGCATRTTSPNAMPHTTPASTAFDERNDENAETIMIDAHAEAVL